MAIAIFPADKLELRVFSDFLSTLGVWEYQRVDSGPEQFSQELPVMLAVVVAVFVGRHRKRSRRTAASK